MTTDAGASSVDCAGEHCVTCADEAVAMTVVHVDRERVLALCEGPDGARSTVETALVERVHGGDRVLVHAGVAIATLDDGECPGAGRHQAGGVPGAVPER